MRGCYEASRSQSRYGTLHDAPGVGNHHSLVRVRFEIHQFIFYIRFIGFAARLP
jgi:hypothetical protein